MIDKEIIYDDSYKRSIFYILKYLRPDTLKEFTDLLDRYGYYGRYNLYREMRKAKLSDFFYLRIYLPHSQMYYRWPYKGYLELGNDRMLDKLINGIPKGSSETFRVSQKMVSVYTSTMIFHSNVRYPNSQKAIDYLHVVGLLKGNSIKRLTSERDYAEIEGNIFNDR